MIICNPPARHAGAPAYLAGGVQLTSCGQHGEQADCAITDHGNRARSGPSSVRFAPRLGTEVVRVGASCPVPSVWRFRPRRLGVLLR